jgi:uncharacterized protein YlxW (UPF0749 family)
MNVTVWAPMVGSILIALIAATTAVFATRAQRAATKEDKTQREADLVVSGLAALVDELQEERATWRLEARECQTELTRLREALAECLNRK